MVRLAALLRTRPCVAAPSPEAADGQRGLDGCWLAATGQSSTLLARVAADPIRDPDPADDHRLVRAFLASDPIATARLAERLQVVPRMIGGLCRRFGLPLTHDEIADTAQDAIAVALRKLHELREPTPLDAWLHRLCSYELSNALRKKRRLSAVDLPEHLASAAESAIAVLERREIVEIALDKLRREDGEVVRLHHLEGLTFAEIAARLGVTTNLVKGRYYRGIAQLASSLRSHHPSRNAP